jgi:hypothetical protein
MVRGHSDQKHNSINNNKKTTKKRQVACLIPGCGAPEVHDHLLPHVDAELRLTLLTALEVCREHFPGIQLVYPLYKGQGLYSETGSMAWSVNFVCSWRRPKFFVR